MSKNAKSLKQLTKTMVAGKIRVAGAATGTAAAAGVVGVIGSAVTITTVVGTHVALNTPAVFAAFAATPVTVATAPLWLPVVSAGLVTAGSIIGLKVASNGAKRADQWLDRVLK